MMFIGYNEIVEYSVLLDFFFQNKKLTIVNFEMNFVYILYI